MSLRNDNGSQFIANAVWEYLKEKGIHQEFSHVTTLQDNAYIEALHYNLQREVIDRFEFESIYHAQLVIERYYKWYNEKRRHWSLNGQTPETVWKNYNPIPFENKKTTKLSLENFPVYRGPVYWCLVKKNRLII